MQTATVSRISEGIAALQAFKDRHGDLPMLNDEGGPFQFRATIWGKDDHLVAGVKLRDFVTVDAVFKSTEKRR